MDFSEYYYHVVKVISNDDLNEISPGTQKPNLIGTAIRCVKEQTSIDLSCCSKWTSLATFVYNRNDSILATDDSDREFSCLFMPDVWTLLEKDNQQLIQEKLSSSSQSSASIIKDSNDDNSDSQKLIIESNDSKIEQNEVKVDQHVSSQPSLDSTEGSNGISDHQADVSTLDTSALDSSYVSATDTSILQQPMDTSIGAIPGLELMEDLSATISEKPQVFQRQELLSRIGELKVTELKSELDERNIKYARNAKKADLLILLTDALNREIEDQDTICDSIKGNWWTNKILSHEDKQQQLTQQPPPLQLQQPSAAGATGSVDPTETSSAPVSDATVAKTESSSGESKSGGEKRKLDSDETSPPSKKSSGDHKNGSLSKSSKSSSSAVPKGTIVVDGDLPFSVLNLHQALNHHKHDHFEVSSRVSHVSVVSNMIVSNVQLGIGAEIIREALVQHFTTYTVSCLVQNQNLIRNPPTEHSEDRRKVCNVYHSDISKVITTHTKHENRLSPRHTFI